MDSTSKSSNQMQAQATAKREIPRARAAIKREHKQQPHARFHKQEQQPNASTSSSQTRDSTSKSSNQTRAQAVAKREQFQKLPRSRAIPATRRGLDRRTSRSSSSFLDREQFRQPDVVSIDARAKVPTASGSASSSNNFWQPQQFSVRQTVSVCVLKDLSGSSVCGLFVRVMCVWVFSQFTCY
ncbi:hypothetical protein WN943_002975 [Citrus x changshan-huyou]